MNIEYARQVTFTDREVVILREALAQYLEANEERLASARVEFPDFNEVDFDLPYIKDLIEKFGGEY